MKRYVCCLRYGSFTKMSASRKLSSCGCQSDDMNGALCGRLSFTSQSAFGQEFHFTHVPKNSHWMTCRSHRVPAPGTHVDPTLPAKSSRSEIFPSRPPLNTSSSPADLQGKLNSNAIKPLPKEPSSVAKLINRPLGAYARREGNRRLPQCGYRRLQALRAQTMQEPEWVSPMQPGVDQEPLHQATR